MDIELLTAQEHKGTFETYFGFRETPFGVTPDPRFFYSTPPSVEALAALVYGISARRGFMLVTGEVGTGKTILLRKLMRQLETTVRFVFISSSHITSYGLIELLVQDLGLNNGEKNRLEMIKELTQYLRQQLRNGDTLALLIDEGQNLSDEVLEGLCGLSNLETDEDKLLQIVLVGQPELAARLSKTSLRRIKQRIAIHHRLYSLQTVSEVDDYIRHRLQVAGYTGPEIFSKEAIESIWGYSAGTPRLINILCDNALAIACAAAKKKVSAYMVMKVAGALLLEHGPEISKTGASDMGIPRRAPAIRSNQKKPETPQAELKTEQRHEGTAVPVHNAERSPLSDKEVVSPEFFAYLIRAATAAMGPMANLVVRDQIASLGESRDAFPQIKLRDLVELVSREILNETMKRYFQKMMFQQIDALKPLRVA
jgi:general secretion pathway protein A